MAHGERRMNLTALQRVDSKITQIIDNASQVALYKFNDEGNEWEKTEIEGTLFVYVRSQVPCHGLIVMNRLNTTNFVEPLNSELEFQLQSPFLLYKNSKGSIFGIWFYDREECTRIENILLRLTDQVQGSKQVGRQRCVSEGGSSKSNPDLRTQQDILSLLSHAQQEYDKQNNSPKFNKIETPANHCTNGDVIKPTPVRASNGYVSTNDKKNSTPLSVATLFAQATASQKRSERRQQKNVAQPLPTPHRSVSVDATTLPDSTPSPKTIMKHLMSNPANKLEHIEKLQQDESASLTTPRARATSCSAAMGPSVSSRTELMAHSLELDIKEKLKLIPTENGKTETLPQDIPKPKFLSHFSCPMDAHTPIMTPAMFEIRMHSPSPQFHHFPLVASPCEEFHPSEPITPSKPLDSDDVSLLSPLAFTKPKSFPISFPNVPSPPPDSLGNGYPKKVSRDYSLLLPEHLESHSLPSLTREQLRESLVYLLKNDNDFLGKIHDAYVASLKAELSRFKT